MRQQNQYIGPIVESLTPRLALGGSENAAQCPTAGRRPRCLT